MNISAGASALIGEPQVVFLAERPSALEVQLREREADQQRQHDRNT
ncbi:MAG TPA: hypothetical protein VFW87_10290 [Pirellulales bacterium]|nr:hypothetical protein [Pirellulales bacterium]